MQLLNNLIFNKVISILEQELVSHEPQAQALLLAEVEALVNKAGEWVKKKLEANQAPQA